MDERDFFDKLAPIWDENETLSLPEKIREVIGYFDLKQGQAILDLGTGTGVLLPYISEKIGESGKLTAVDFSKGMLEIAQKKYKSLLPSPHFLNIDFEEETIEDEFDRIILYCVFPHLHRPFDTIKWLERVNLKTNGKIFIAFPCSPDFINSIHKERHSDSNVLPGAVELCKALQAVGLKAAVKADSDDLYIVEINKKCD